MGAKPRQGLHVDPVFYGHLIFLKLLTQPLSCFTEGGLHFAIAIKVCPCGIPILTRCRWGLNTSKNRAWISQQMYSCIFVCKAELFRLKAYSLDKESEGSSFHNCTPLRLPVQRRLVYLRLQLHLLPPQQQQQQQQLSPPF